MMGFNSRNRFLMGCYSLKINMVGLGLGMRSRDPHRTRESRYKGKPEGRDKGSFVP